MHACMMGWGDEAFGNGDLTPITHDTWKQKQEQKHCKWLRNRRQRNIGYKPIFYLLTLKIICTFGTLPIVDGVNDRYQPQVVENFLIYPTFYAK